MSAANANAPATADAVCLGVIGAPWGVRGEVRVRAFTARPENIAAYGSLFTGGGAPLRVEALRGGGAASSALVVRFAGIRTRAEAQALAGERLYIPRSALPPVAADEWYHADLIGLPACDRTGAACARVRAVWDFGAGDLLELAHLGDSSRSAFIPFTRENVAEVRLSAAGAPGRIVLTDSAKRFEWQ